MSVEVGLLALALTPVIITGGIDLSVGSMMGLAAVVLGALWRDAQLPIARGRSVALLVGFAGGALNGFLIARLKLAAVDRHARNVFTLSRSGGRTDARD